MAAKAGASGSYLVAHPDELKLRVEYLISVGDLDREDVGDISKLNEGDCSLISTLYDLANHQLRVHHYDKKHGKWCGYLNESYEEAMDRQNDILNQPINE